MTADREAFHLYSRSPGQPAPVLAGVHAQGRLDGLLFELTLRQTYRHAGPAPLEVVYTFPLPAEAVLTGFAAILNGERQVGTVVARPDAERRYEASLAEGDAPVMLERRFDGLHVANIGNLKPGDELVVELRYAELQAFEQGRLRLAIPTTIAPRYGNPAAAGLQPQQVPESTLDAHYPLTLQVEVAGLLARCVVDCPTHPFTRQEQAGAVRLTLAEGATLDRDVVLLVQPQEPLPSLVMQADDAVPGAAPRVRLAALQLPLASGHRPVGLKLLVDCSGSMAGVGIDSARAALRSLVAGLGPADHVALSRFGSSVQHLLEPGPARADRLPRLAAQVDALEADLGGTEMAMALESVLALPAAAGAPGTDVLLITDGEIWNVDGVIEAACRHGQRIFAIGVGSAPAAGGLRRLAQESGGACEFATPGESLHAAAMRMAVRLRQPRLSGLRIDWGAEPLWQTPLGRGLFGGDTVTVWAGLPATAGAPVARLLAQDEQGRLIELARAEADAPCAGDTLPRLAAARRLGLLPAAEATAMAVAYQLISDHTHCILVHERAAQDKVREAAALHRVTSMLAAGWGGSGQHVTYSIRVDSMTHSGERHMLARRSVAMAPVMRESLAAPDAVASSGSNWPLLAEFEKIIQMYLQRRWSLDEVVSEEHMAELHPDFVRAMMAVAEALPGQHAFWILLMHWIHHRPDGTPDPAIDHLLQPHLDALPPELVQPALERIEHCLGRWSIHAWVPTRAERLKGAMRGKAG